MQIPEQSRSIDSNANLMVETLTLKSNTAAERVLIGLLQKANAEELNTLHSFLHSSKLGADEPSLLDRLISEKINKHTS